MSQSTVLQPVSDKANWLGHELNSDTGWRYSLTADHVSDLKKLVANVLPILQSDPNRLLTLSTEHFALGSLESLVEQMYEQLKSGLGLALLRGLPINDFTTLELAIIYWAIGQNLGTATPNNPDGDMFGHITDVGKTQKDANSRGYQTREAMDYHCDQADMVGLLCLRTAKSGGTSRVASSIAMYNSLVTNYPEHAQILSDSMYWSKMGEFSPGDKPYYRSPVFNFPKERLCVSFGPTHIEKGHALPDTPNLSHLQREAIRKAEEIAHEQRLDMQLQPGDMQFLNNYVALHTRSSYIDHEEPEKKRLLWRLWLMNDDLRERTGYTNNFRNGVVSDNNPQQLRL